MTRGACGGTPPALVGLTPLGLRLNDLETAHDNDKAETVFSRVKACRYRAGKAYGAANIQIGLNCDRHRQIDPSGVIDRAILGSARIGSVGGDIVHGCHEVQAGKFADVSLLP